MFAASFFHPRTSRGWKAMGAFTAFLVALFTEMYGLPLTVYLLSGWLGAQIPALQPTHAGGHLFKDLISRQGDPTAARRRSWVGIEGRNEPVMPAVILAPVHDQTAGRAQARGAGR